MAALLPMVSIIRATTGPRTRLSVVRIFETGERIQERRIWLILGFSLGGIFEVVQAPLFDGFAFGLLPFQQDGLSASDINVGGRKIV